MCRKPQENLHYEKEYAILKKSIFRIYPIFTYCKKGCSMIDTLLQSTWPEWQIEKQIGRGSYGDVFKAYREEGGARVYAAIKLISIPQDDFAWETLRAEGMTQEATEAYYRNVLNEFLNEVDVMLPFRGAENIVNIEDYAVIPKDNEHGWSILIRMELLKPLNIYLYDRIISEDEVLQLGEDICTALELCSEKNIIHRDIKPENVFVTADGHFKLGDFGIAKQLDGLTVSLSQKGTRNYMAPEVAMGTHYDKRADIYSLGMMLYRLGNMNHLPFLADKQLLSPGDRRSALTRRLSGEALPMPEGVSEELGTVILKACAFSPEDRYQSAGELKAALLAYRAAKKARLLAPADEVSRSRKRGLRCIIAALLLLILLLLTRCAQSCGAQPLPSATDPLPDFTEQPAGSTAEESGSAVSSEAGETDRTGSSEEAAASSESTDPAAESSSEGMSETAAETTAIPQTTKAPEATAVPQTTKAPETTAVPQTTKAPETTAVPQTTKAPESVHVHQYSGYYCTECGAERPGNESFVYTPSSDGKSMIFTSEGDDFGSREAISVVSRTVDGLPVTAIGPEALSGRQQKTLLLPDTLKTIMDHAFVNAHVYGDLTIPNGVTKLGSYSFQTARIYGKLTLPNTLISIGHSSFMAATVRDSLVIPDSVTSIGDYAFSSLATGSIHLGAGVKDLGVDLFCNSNGNGRPQTLTVSSANPYYYSSGNCVIRKSDGALVTGLQDSTIPQSGIRSIAPHAFFGLSLSSAFIPEGVTEIGELAFSCGSSIVSVSLPSTLKHLSDNVFGAESAFETISYNGTIESWKAIDKAANWKEGCHAFTILCHDGEYVEP